MEIERKFLVRELSDDVDRSQSRRIEQGYLAIEEGGTEVRVRRSNGDAVLTVKVGRGRSRSEEEIAINAESFARLWPLTAGRRLEKTRHRVPTGAGLTVELDVYSGALDGLAVAEIEFPSEDEAQAFRTPEWFGSEVTDDPRFKNQKLAREGAPPDVIPKA